MNMTAKLPLVLAAHLMLGLSLTTLADSSVEVERVLAQAEATLERARESGNAWTSTGKLIAAARQADSEAEALELAQRALLTARRALEQQRREQDAWQARVPS